MPWLDGKRAFEQEVATRLSKAEIEKEKAFRWRDRFTSLWTPITILAILFVPYLVVVEIRVCAHLWLQPVMKGLALGLTLYLFILIIARGVFRRFSVSRDLRHQVLGFLEDVGKVASKHRHDMGQKAYEGLVDDAAVLRRAALADSSEVVAALLEKQRDQFKPLRRQFGRTLHLDSVGGVVWALGAVILLRVVVIEPFKIPSGSMIPTLEIGDQIFVNKLIYGVRIPFANVLAFPQLVRSPERGDVIVFNNPVEPDKDYIKRVIGVPGDRIEIHRKVITVNGVEQPVSVVNEEYLYADEQGGRWQLRESALVKEQFDSGPHWTMRDRGPPYQEMGPFTVPEGHVFVMGDNRDNSLDSRYGLGDFSRGIQYVPFERIKGKAMAIWFAWGHNGVGSSFLQGAGLRTERLFQPVAVCENAPPPAPAVDN